MCLCGKFKHGVNGLCANCWSTIDTPCAKKEDDDLEQLKKIFGMR